MSSEMHNWGRDIYSRPAVVVEPESVEQIQEILRDREQFPSPVRAVGSNHSTTACATADGGTVVISVKESVKGMSKVSKCQRGR